MVWFLRRSWEVEAVTPSREGVTSDVKNYILSSKSKIDLGVLRRDFNKC